MTYSAAIAEYQPQYDRHHMSIEALRRAMATSLVIGPMPAPHINAEPLVKAWWIAEVIHGYADAMATQQMLGFIEDGKIEVYGAAAKLARVVKTPPAVTAAAVAKAWTQAETKGEKFATDMRFAIWPMGKAQMSGDAIIATAQRISAKHGVLLSDEDLIEIAAKIAHAAVTRRRNGRG